MRRWKKIGAVAVVVGALAAITGPAAYGWDSFWSIPIDEYGASSTQDGYVFGGYSFSAGHNLDNAYHFNLFSGGWNQLAPMPDANLMSSAVPSWPYIYVFGGSIHDPDTLPPPVDYCRRYDIDTNTWDTCPPMPGARGFMASGYDPDNGKIYLAGGYSTADIDSAQTTTWEFDPVTGTYTQKAAMPNGLGGGASGFINGRLYVAGGRDASNTILDTLYIYDPATNTWSEGPPMPQPENVPGYTVNVTNAEDGVCCALYLFGYGNPLSGVGPLGRDPTETSSFGPTAGATTLIFNPAADSWAFGSDLNVAKSFSSGFDLALPPPRGEGPEGGLEYDVVSAGGLTSDTTSTDDTEAWVVSPGCNCPIPPPPPATAPSTTSASAAAAASSTATTSASASPSTATAAASSTPTSCSAATTAAASSSTAVHAAEVRRAERRRPEAGEGEGEAQGPALPRRQDHAQALHGREEGPRTRSVAEGERQEAVERLQRQADGRQRTLSG